MKGRISVNKFVVVGKVIDSDETTGYVLKNRETNEIGMVSRYAALELARRNDLINAKIIKSAKVERLAGTNGTDMRKLPRMQGGYKSLSSADYSMILLKEILSNSYDFYQLWSKEMQSAKSATDVIRKIANTRGYIPVKCNFETSIRSNNVILVDRIVQHRDKLVDALKGLRTDEHNIASNEVVVGYVIKNTSGASISFRRFNIKPESLWCNGCLKVLESVEQNAVEDELKPLQQTCVNLVELALLATQNNMSMELHNAHIRANVKHIKNNATNVFNILNCIDVHVADRYTIGTVYAEYAKGKSKAEAESLKFAIV